MPERLVIEDDPEDAPGRFLAQRPLDRAINESKKCSNCGAGMERKVYVYKYPEETTPEVWVCPNREDGKHPDPYHAEPTGR